MATVRQLPRERAAPSKTGGGLTATAAPGGERPLRTGPRAANPARVCDLLLGGKDNYAGDRALVDRLLQIQPHLVTAARENRAFLGRAVRALARQGVRQFLDIGCGLPTRENVHQMAARHVPGTRVVYVDHDSTVLAHARALLTDDGNAAVIRADLRRPDELLGDVSACGLLDLDAPVAILLTGVLHLLADDDDPHGIVAVLRGSLVPGGALVISHGTGDVTPAESAAVAEVYSAGCTAQLVPRCRRDVAAFFGDLNLIEPGVAFTTQWRPDGPARPAEQALAYAGIGIHAQGATPWSTGPTSSSSVMSRSS